MYSEPAKVYGEPAKIYSEPAKVYSEPAKVYSDTQNMPNKPPTMIEMKEPMRQQTQQSNEQSSSHPPWRYLPAAMGGRTREQSSGMPHRKPIFTDLIKVPYDALNAPLDEYPRKPKMPLQIHQQQNFDHNVTSDYQHYQQFIPKNNNFMHTTQQPEQNYEIEEGVSVMTNGRAHGIQTTMPATAPSTTTQSTFASEAPSALDTGSDGIQGGDPPQDSKFGYVVEGRNYRKYRVEEKTPDGFIVGEYGVVSNNDGTLRGVRYTADSNINPRLIYDALLKFLSL